ncbi:hypothetical protein [Sphingomonas sp. Ant20]|uniref:hypothetical protein n=1 Tax=Sphingomonas sp. Ant20 TaxID=104605 RepID=UPI000A8E4371|nr:hypothetical protein [Sphingomonas sp. Ant20]
MLTFDDLVAGPLYEIFDGEGVSIGCGERDEIKGFAEDGIYGHPLDALRFKRVG